MKKVFLSFILIYLTISIQAQNKEQNDLIKIVEELHQSIFIKKDSSALERIFAKEITYGHSGGKLENRKEAIEDISHNQSTYTNISIDSIDVLFNGKTAVSRYVLKGDETNKNNKLTHLHLNILMTWIKEKNKWKMFARQAVKLG